jgi:hypothetical protein
MVGKITMASLPGELACSSPNQSCRILRESIVSQNHTSHRRHDMHTISILGRPAALHVRSMTTPEAGVSEALKGQSLE